MLKIITVFILALFNFNAYAFEFYSTDKAAIYNINKFSSQISKEYKDDFKLYVVLVAAKSSHHKLYKEQFNTLDKLDVESLSLIFISAISNKEDAHGYHTSMSVAKSILRKNDFVVEIYSPDGDKISGSTSVYTKAQIEELIRKHNTAPAYAKTARLIESL